MPQSSRANSGAYSGSEMVVSMPKREERDKSLGCKNRQNHPQKKKKFHPKWGKMLRPD